MSTDDLSSSGEIISSFENISDVFTSYSEIPSRGFNRLYKAQRYGKWFVLKGLKPEFQHKELYRELLTKEFELGLRMDHPNIARIISKETDPVAGPCLVMEYVDGVTLKEFMTQRPSRKTRLKIVKELLDAMSYYHSLQIIHRDLKPDNILITRNGYNVKIIDFGLADSDWHGVFKQPTGSNKYAAPEQLSGNVPLDNRADLYAFGVILRQIFPHAYGHIARKCMRYDRERRFSNADEILQQLQRGKWLILFLILIILFCLAAGVWLFSSATSQETTKSLPSQKGIVDTIELLSDVVMESEDASSSSSALEERKDMVVTVSSEEQNKAVASMKEELVSSGENGSSRIPSKVSDNRQIPSEVSKIVEQTVDTLFRQFWDWEKAATVRGLSSNDKWTEYSQSNFFKHNYEIRERHREAVVNDILRRYPQYESDKELVTTFYNSTFVKKMVAVNNEVNTWQRGVR